MEAIYQRFVTNQLNEIELNTYLSQNVSLKISYFLGGIGAQ